ncbi:MAG TPA: hypothetical protein VE046_12175 [Steroidobacteraceae bacterium]|nr:hypothetical protein [Steroidobacteraceae bacterium]
MADAIRQHRVAGEAQAPPARTQAPAKRPDQRPRAPGVTVPQAQPAAAPRTWITKERVFFTIAIVAIYLGWKLPTERYLTPKSGFGYALGIIGGSLVLLLLLYSVRKRVSWLGFLGSVNKWFEVHMVLGVLAPICILYHANFSLGATNSNVAFWSMMIVAASGLVGRYIYSHIHFGLYGRKMSLGELRASSQRLRTLESTVAFLPELVGRLEREERRMLASGPRLPVLGILKPAGVALNALRARWHLRAYVRRSLRMAARRSTTIAAQRRRLRRAASAYIDRRLVATRKVAEFEAYERLFSVWHLLHVPLLFILITAAIVHVIAVHVY